MDWMSLRLMKILRFLLPRTVVMAAGYWYCCEKAQVMVDSSLLDL